MSTKLIALPQVVTCHCTHCKRYTGSAFSSNIIVPQTALHFTCGTPKLFMDDTDAGPKLRRQFCGDCGTPLTSEPTKHPEVIVVKSGTLDDRDAFSELGMEIYYHRRDKFMEHINDENVQRIHGSM